MLFNEKVEYRQDKHVPVESNGMQETNENMPNKNPNTNHIDSATIKPGVNVAAAPISNIGSKINSEGTSKSSATQIPAHFKKEAASSPQPLRFKTMNKVKRETENVRRSAPTGAQNGKRSKAGYEIVLTQIPKHADLKIVKGAIRARIGKFKCVRCEMYRHGMCKIWVRKPETRDKILCNAIYIFGVQIEAGLKMPTDDSSVSEGEGEGNESTTAVHLSNIPPNCTVKKLMGMVKQIVGDFVACNRVTIEKGCSKIIFKYLKHQKTLLKNGFGGELGGVVISAHASSATPHHGPVLSGPEPPSLQRTQRLSSKFETPSPRVTDAMSCSDGSSSARSPWHNMRRNRGPGSAATGSAVDSDSAMSWSDMVNSTGGPGSRDHGQLSGPSASTQREAAAELLYAQQSARGNGRGRRRKVNRVSSISASYLMLENEKLRMEIELMRMQYHHPSNNDGLELPEDQPPRMSQVRGGYYNAPPGAYAAASPPPGTAMDAHLEDYYALPSVHDSYEYQSWMDHANVTLR